MKSGGKYIFAIVLTLALSGFTTAKQKEYLDWSTEDYVLVFEEGTGWKGVGGEETKKRIYTTPGSTVDDWNLTLDLTCFPIAVTLMSKMRWNPESIMDAEKRTLAKRGCEGPWLIINSDSKSILYERPDVNCPGFIHQYELGRIVMGKWYCWWIRYRIRNRELSEDEKSDLIGRLELAGVVRQK